jgi:hypothetical protein
MSYNNINPSVPVNALRDVLIADTTLQGSSYLTSSGRIFTRRAPAGQASPFLVIEAKEIFSNGIFQFTGEIRIFCYTALLSNGQIDARGDLILYRCQELLNDQQIAITGMSVVSLTTSVVPSFFDPESDDSKARGVLRVKLDFGQV